MSRNICKQVSLIFISNFHTTHTYHVAPRQPGKLMNKVLGGTKKKYSYHEDLQKISNNFSKPKKIHLNPKRVTVLNKLFMRNITDLMSTEAYASQVLGLGIEINRVQITPDFKILNVFWTTNNAQQDKAEEVLMKNAGLLKHELSQLRLMGNVPTINFVKDKHFANIMELNKRLAIADYGEEGPSGTDLAAYLISECELNLPIEQKLKEEIAKLEEENPIELSDPELPPMTHCVFNLDHENIMNKIRKGQRKPKMLNDDGRVVDENWASFKLEQYSKTTSADSENVTLQRDVFNKFLQERQLIKKKYRDSQYDDPDTDYFEENADIERNMKFMEDEDFILEDENDSR